MFSDDLVFVPQTFVFKIICGDGTDRSGENLGSFLMHSYEESS